MNLLKKVETLLNATARAKLPRRKRRSALDKQEKQLLAEIRQAVTQVQAQERVLADRLKAERTSAEEAAQRGDRAEQRAHEKRASELARELEQESIQAINLEERLAALEEKLALAKEAVKKQAKAAALKEEEAAKAMAQGASTTEAATQSSADLDQTETIPEEFTDDDPDIGARKTRLSG
jgi:uncharacterized coiled-coil protein SlyX